MRSLLLITILFLSACDNNDSGLLAGPNLSLNGAVELSVTPQVSQTPIGFDIQYKAEVLLSDGTVSDVTEDHALTWSISNSTLANISNLKGSRGKVSPFQAGEVTITASGEVAGQMFSDTAILTITDAAVTALTVTPKVAQTPVGIEVQYRAEATLSDGNVLDVTEDDAVSWSSSDNGLASVSNDLRRRGLVTGVSPGEVTITATGTANGVTFSDSANLKVSSAIVTALTVTPKVAQTPVGIEVQYRAEATLSDGSVLDVTEDDAVSWSSSDNGLASVSNDLGRRGLVTGVSPGEVTITATSTANGVRLTSNMAQLEVTEATLVSLTVSPDGKIPVGASWPVTAVATLSNSDMLDVTKDTNTDWTSSFLDIADVNEGTVHGLKEGITQINAAYIFKGNLTLGDAPVTIEVSNSNFLLEAEHSTFYGDKLGIQYSSIPAELAFPSVDDPQGVKIDSFNQFWGYSNLSKTLEDLEMGDNIRIIANIDVANSDANRTNLLGINIVDRATGDTIVIPTTCSTTACEATYVWTSVDDTNVYSAIIFKASGGANGTTIVYDTMQVIVN